MKKRNLVLALCAIGSIGLAGCNDDDSDNNFSSTSGDTIILTSDGMISSINKNAPDEVVSNRSVSGLQSGDELVGIDYRPSNGMLYAVGMLGNIYTVDPDTGEATFVAALTADPKDTTDGNDPFESIMGDADLITVNFNPVADRLRVMTETGQNLRINVDTGATITDGMINMNGGDPSVIAGAYTNAFAGTGSTKLYSLDQNSDRIYLQNANAGTLGMSTALATGVDIAGSIGFDIDGINNEAFIALKSSGQYMMHTLNLANVATGADAVVSSSNLASSYNDKNIRGITLKPAEGSSAMALGLTTDNKMLSFSLMTPSETTEIMVTGLATDERLVGIDYRLRTMTDNSGMLYGLTNQSNLYTIDPATGVSTMVSTLTPAADSAFEEMEGEQFVVDFNPAADRLRVISNTGQNLRINVDTGETILDGEINGIEGAVVTGAAYTNSFQTSIEGLGTALFDIDQANNLLAQQLPPNDGTLISIGTIANSLGMDNGFDIAGGDNGFAFATVPSTSGGSMLYRVDINPDTSLTTPRMRPAVNVDGTPNAEASMIGGDSSVIDIAILLK